MVSVRMEAGALMTALKNVSKNLPKQLAIIANKAGRKGESLVAKDITKELAVTQKTVKKQISRRKTGKTQVTLVLKKSSRIPLRDFKARQTKKGVTYRISKSKGRKTVPGAFQGPAPGRINVKWRGRVFKRTGKKRLPIQQLFGPSPWGVFVKNNRIRPVTEEINKEMKKQFRRRIRYLKLKQSGAI